ncbi:MAG: tetratricopeptide repeat protein [Thermodesulfovibrionales bacterium]|nr:tetratricopeptide repeat protein [Thermodesulfovibrionales bacterium]
MSGLNPTGFNSFFITFSPEYFPFIKGIQEYVPPFENISKIKLMRPDYGHLILLFLCAFVLILRNLRFDFSYFLILLFLGIVSLKAMRFSIYFSLIGSLIFAIEFNRWLSSIEDKVTLLKKKKTFLDVALISAILLSISLFVIGFGKIRFSFKYLWIPDVSVAGAAEFIKQNNLKNNMLNSYASGGYLSWRLYPEYKTFIDSRGLNLTVMAEYGWIFEGLDSLYKSALPKDKIPLWKRLLDYYKINFIIFELDTFGTVPKLFFKLMQEENWIPVYIDLRSVIFVRNIPEHKKVIDKHKKSFDELVNYLIVKTTVGAMNHEYNPRYLMSLGEIFTKLNRLDDAIKAYKYALKRMPDNEVIKKKIEELEKKKEVER